MYIVMKGRQEVIRSEWICGIIHRLIKQGINPQGLHIKYVPTEQDEEE